MFGILVSAFNTAMAFIFKSVIAKLFVFFALYFVVSEFISYLSSKLPDFSELSGAFSALPSNVWYFLDLVNFSQGFSLCLSAYLLRFMIRRIPLIG